MPTDANILQTITDQIQKSAITQMILQMVISCGFLAIMSSLFTQVVKIAYEKVFAKKLLEVKASWYINVIFIIVAVNLFSFFKNDLVTELATSFSIVKVLFILAYNIQLVLYTWVLSELSYVFVVKLLFTGMEIVLVKAGALLAKSKTEKATSEAETSKVAELDITKKRELVLEKLSEVVTGMTKTVNDMKEDKDGEPKV